MRATLRTALIAATLTAAGPLLAYPSRAVFAQVAADRAEAWKPYSRNMRMRRA